MLKKFIFPLWVLGGILLTLYSYTQIDLSLTLSQASIAQDIQKSFQSIGWFQRPLSTYLYIGLLVYLFTLFIVTLNYVSKKNINSKTIWKIIIVVAAILIPSYNAFSYDLFNYIFDARIVSFYNANPYELKPLDFPEDPMLSFMRSTHRVYPYGPAWLGVTVPLTFLASEIFAVSLALFKLLSAVSYLGICYFLLKISKRLKLKDPLYVLSFFALNPLVLIEGLVSSHNEIVMMFFAVMSFYFLFAGKNAFSIFSLLISIGIKYATVVLLPITILKIFYKKITDDKLIFYAVLLGIAAVIATSLASGQNKGAEFQPWYLMLIAPLIPLYEDKLIRTVFVFLSFTVLMSYVPFLYAGEWPENIVMFKNILIITGIAIGSMYYFIRKIKV